ncbi:MAG: TonB-dependent receptor [Chitinophagaceae bacterium]|nr:TonB-dependent receptor [Chitinophagaceae bacterium]
MRTHKKTHNTFYAIFVMLFLQVFVSFAQPCSFDIQGKIITKHTQSAIPFATVWIEELKRGEVTDEKGIFRFQNICKKNYTLEIQHIGYQNFTMTLHSLEKNEFIIELDEGTLLLQEIDVDETYKKTESSQAFSLLKQKGIENNFSKNLANILQDIPGMSVLQTGPGISKPIVNGLYGSRVLIINNGIRQEGQQWGNDHAPEIDPNTAQNISVIKGASGVKYGAEAMGGIIIIEPSPIPYNHKDIHTKTLVSGSSNGRMVAFNGALEGGNIANKNIGWKLQSSYKKGGDFHSPKYMLTNTGVEELNASGALGIDKKKWKSDVFYSRFQTTLGILASAHIGNLTDLQKALSSSEPFIIKDFSYTIDNPKQYVSHNVFKWNVEIKDILYGKMLFVYGFQNNMRQEFDIRRTKYTDKPSLDLVLNTHSVDVAYEHTLLHNIRGEAGISAIFQQNTNTPGTGIIPLVPNYDAATFGFFLLEKYSFQKKITLELGCRYDMKNIKVFTFDSGKLVTPQFQYQNISAILGGSVHLTKYWDIRSHISSGWRPPNVNELFSQGLHHGAAGIEEGDKKLKAERSWTWTNQIVFSHNDWLFDINVFVQNIQNYIYLQPQKEFRYTIRGVFPVFHYQQTDAFLSGLDFLGSVKIIPPLEYKFTASLIRAMDITQNDYLIYIPADRFTNSLFYSWKIPKDKKIMVGIKYKKIRTQDRVPENQDYLPPPNGYDMFDMEGSFDFLWRKNYFKVSFQANNIFNTSYREYLNRFRYFADEIGRNISVQLTWTYQ